MPKISVGQEVLPRVCQGDVFRDVDQIRRAEIESGTVEIEIITHSLVVVLTQDCDLEQDRGFRFSEEPLSTQDKHLMSVLVAPVYNAEHFFRGEHLSQLGMKMQVINHKATHGKHLRTNQLPRYHYLEFPSPVQIVPSMIDFKHYFTVSVEYLEKAKDRSYVCSVSPLFREDISQRFANFLARIGLPDPEREKVIV